MRHRGLPWYQNHSHAREHDPLTTIIIREVAQAILLGDLDNSNDISQYELARVHATHTAFGVQRALSFCQTIGLIMWKEITLALAGR